MFINIFHSLIQVMPQPPSPNYPDPQKSAMEKLFMEIAGDDMEVDWMELKRILDHTMRDGECHVR